MIEFHSQTRCTWHSDCPINKVQSTVDDDVLELPRPMRVEGVGEVRHRCRYVRHCGEADTQMRVRVHRESEVERVTDLGQSLDLCQASPVVVVGKNHLHRLLLNRRRDVFEAHHAHVRRERHRHVARDLGHSIEPRRRVFEILQDAVELSTDLDRGRDGPRGVGVEP
jgi:hypothetical protein